MQSFLIAFHRKRHPLLGRPALKKVLVVAAATALGQTRSSHEPTGSAQAPQSSAVAGAAIAAPAWCCATGSIPGITVTGQAMTMDEKHGGSAAIAEAVADATDQAKAAADAAGTQLGEVLDMQVSVMPVVYPMMETAPQPGVAVGSGSSSGGADPGATGPDAPVRRAGRGIGVATGLRTTGRPNQLGSIRRPNGGGAGARW